MVYNGIPSGGGGGSNPAIIYTISDIDEVGLVNYYGFITTGGKFYIMKEDKTTFPNTYRYYNDNGNLTYVSKWASRLSNTYVYLFNLSGL